MYKEFLLLIKWVYLMSYIIISSLILYNYKKDYKKNIYESALVGTIILDTDIIFTGFITNKKKDNIEKILNNIYFILNSSIWIWQLIIYKNIIDYDDYLNILFLYNFYFYILYFIKGCIFVCKRNYKKFFIKNYIEDDIEDDIEDNTQI